MSILRGVKRHRASAVSDECLVRWRELPAAATLEALCDYCKADPAFRPIKNPGTERWHVRVGEREFELLLNGAKFFDARTRRGGGGAIDLAMFLLDADFRSAAAALTAASL